ncbi:MAG: hypothetical protein II304_03070 [Bacteroidales bacterium]|nr:hypothetical protein [Bacteroidales bacterium]
MGLGDFLKGIATRANMGINDFLNGKAAIPTDRIGQLKIGDDGIAQIDMGVSQNPRSGGFLQGFQENRTTPFAVENLEPNNKGWNFKLGEAAGTTARGVGKLGGGVGTGLKAVGRGLDSPLGRAALVGGIVGLTGGNPLQMLTYGATTGMMNQANRMKDQMYRRELAKYGFDTSGIGGYIGDDTFNKYLQSKQLQDNAEWRRANLEAQQAQQRALEGYRGQQIALDRARLDLLSQKGQKSGNLDNLNAVNAQLQRFEDTFKNMPSKLESNTLGRLRAATGFQTENEANFNSQRQLLFNKIARDLGGEKGVLSDKDINRIEGALPSYTDSYAQKQAKMAAIYDLLNDRLSVEGGNITRAINNKSEVATTNEGWAF